MPPSPAFREKLAGGRCLASLGMVLFFLAGVELSVTDIARGGEYHHGATLVCAECHVLREGDRASLGARVGPPLRAASSNDLCLSCHDNRPGIPDVRGTDANAGTGPRQAGALPTGAAPYPEWAGHTLGSPGPPPGGEWPAGETSLRCISCHTAHGNDNYRNLGGAVTGIAITYATSSMASSTANVRIDVSAVPPVGERVAGGFYRASKIYFNRIGTTSSPYGLFCAGCHASFYGVANTNPRSPFRRHPADAVGLPPAAVSRYNSRTNKVPVLFRANGSNVVYDSTATLSCMSCHKAHGNENPFALIFMRATGPVTEQGVDGGRLTDLCGQCHPRSPEPFSSLHSRPALPGVQAP